MILDPYGGGEEREPEFEDNNISAHGSLVCGEIGLILVTENQFFHACDSMFGYSKQIQYRSKVRLSALDSRLPSARAL